MSEGYHLGYLRLHVYNTKPPFKYMSIYKAWTVYWKILLSCIMGYEGTSIFEAWPILETKTQDISDSAASASVIF